MQHILVTTDLSAESFAAFEKAKELCTAFKVSRLSLLSVVETPVLFIDSADAMANYSGMEELLQEQQASAEKRLQELAEERFGDINTSCHVQRTAIDVATSIADFCGAEAVDLLVMASHGRKGFRRFLLGSVTDRVLRETCTPVLVVPIPAPGDE